AGEALQITLEIRTFFKSRQCRLHNHYGPTETHVCTGYRLSENPDDWAAMPSIGTPVINHQIHILDRTMQPVPVGIPAEVYVGGAGVARGYLNRADLTAERFVPNPMISSESRLLSSEAGPAQNS